MLCPPQWSMIESAGATRHHPSHSAGLDAPGAHFGGLDWLGPCKVTVSPCPLSWGTPEPPSPVVAGQGHQLWLPPSNQTGRKEGARPLLPRREECSGRVATAERQNCSGLSFPCWFHKTSLTCGPAWARRVEPWRAEKLLCHRVVEEWVLAEKSFSVLPAFLLTSQGAPFMFVGKDFDFAALWIGTQSSVFS